MNSGPMGMDRKYTFSPAAQPSGSKRETGLHLSTNNAMEDIMRKLLLATTVLALAGAGTALAEGSGEVVITAAVSPLCSMTDPDDIDFGLDPNAGASEQSEFSINCNFTGNNNGDLQITFLSANGGLLNDAEGETRLYSIGYNAQSFSSADAQSGYPVGDDISDANTDESRSLTVTLDEALDLAGDYTDTLTVSIAP